MATLDNQLYQGTPGDILSKIATQVSEVLIKEGLHINGVTILALLHLVMCMLHADHGVGKKPSFQSCLSLLTHGVTKSQWSSEEVCAFDDEFCAIVESLGGTKISKDASFPHMLGPSLGVH